MLSCRKESKTFTIFYSSGAINIELGAGLSVQKYEDSGLPYFSLYNIPKLGKMYQIPIQYTKWSQNLQMAVKYSKWEKNIPTSSIVRPSRIYPN
jgi:hypothetical protein